MIPSEWLLLTRKILNGEIGISSFKAGTRFELF